MIGNNSQISDEMSNENNRLSDDLTFERHLNEILNNIRNVSLLLINDCICDKNKEIREILKQLSDEYENTLTLKDITIKTEEPETTQLDQQMLISDQTNDEVKEEPINENNSSSNLFETSPQTEDSNFQLITELLQSNREIKHQILDEMIVSSQQNCDQSYESQANDRTNHLSNETTVPQINIERTNETNNSFNSSLDLTEVNTQTDSSLKTSATQLQSNTTTFRNLNETETNETNIDTNQEIIQSQERRVNKTSKFCCDNCHQKFESELELKIHLNSVHKNIRSFICNECKELFDSSQSLTKHLNQIHKNSIKKLNCDFCSLRFHSKRILEIHLLKKHKTLVKNSKKHSKLLSKRRSVYKICYTNNCYKIFETERSLLLHKQKVHSKKKNTEKLCCDSCNYKTCRKYKLIRHKKTHSLVNNCDVVTNPIQRALPKSQHNSILNASLGSNLQTKSREPVLNWTDSSDDDIVLNASLGSNLNRNPIQTAPPIKLNASHGSNVKENPKSVVISSDSSDDDYSNIVAKNKSAVSLDLDCISITSSDISEVIITDSEVKTFNYECKECDRKFESFLWLKCHYIGAHDKNIKEHQCNECELSFDTNRRLVRHKRKKHINKPFKEKNNKSILKSVLEGKKRQLSCVIQGCNKTFEAERQLKIHLLINHSKSRSTFL